MLPAKSRRGVWVPKACAIPMLVLLLVMITFDRCSRH